MSVMKIVRADEIPYAQIPNELIRDPNLSGNAVRLWAYLASHSDGYNLTYEQIERQTGMKQFAITESTKKLVESGWLLTVRERNEVTQRWLPMNWILLNKATTGDSTMAHSTMEQPIHKNTNNLTKDIKKTTIKNVGDLFDKFWGVYPIKSGKQAARKAFEKALQTIDAETIVAGAERYRDDPNRSDSFTKHASTWLNAGCWDDAPLPVRVKTKTELDAEVEERKKLEYQKILDAQKRRDQEAAELKARIEADPIIRCLHGKPNVVCRVCK